MPPLRRKRPTTTIALLLVAVGMLALVWWDRQRSGETQHALVPGAALVASWSLATSTITLRFERHGVAWTVLGPTGNEGKVGNTNAIDALLAELELAEILGDAPAQPAANALATITLGDTRVVVYGAAIDGTYVERCLARNCRTLVTRARLAALLAPEGGWQAPPDGSQ